MLFSQIHYSSNSQTGHRRQLLLTPMQRMNRWNPSSEYGYLHKSPLLQPGVVWKLKALAGQRTPCRNTEPRQDAQNASKYARRCAEPLNIAAVQLFPRSSDARRNLLAFLQCVKLHICNLLWEPPHPYLSEVPTELIMWIADFLPLESAICLSVTSKMHFAVFSPRLDMKFRNFMTPRENKTRFLRLLEVDIPELFVCRSCNKMFHWKHGQNTPRYACPCRSQRQPKVPRLDKYDCLPGILCFPFSMQPETVGAFVRGYERGSTYGPQLSELEHSCKDSKCWALDDMTRSIQARMVEGRLLVWVTNVMSIPLRSQSRLVLEIDKFRRIGCRHSRNLPAVVMKVIDQIRHHPSSNTLVEYVLCNECATDLRVQVDLPVGEHLRIQVETWHCLGGRDLHVEHPSVQAIFPHVARRAGKYRSAQNWHPTRNLEKLYNERRGPDLHLPFAASLPESGTQRTWIAPWYWGWERDYNLSDEVSYYVSVQGDWRGSLQKFSAVASVAETFSRWTADQSLC